MTGLTASGITRLIGQLSVAASLSIAVPCGATEAGQPTDTHVAFEQIDNARDLGGLVTADGHKIKPGRLFRSANPGLASTGDIARLKTFHLDAVVDFRTPSERSPATEQAFAAAFPWISDPVLSGDFSAKSFFGWLRTATAQDADAFMIDSYRRFPSDFQSQFKAFLTLAEQNKSILYHCTKGKDRTGFASLLLLSALGVAPDTIMDNYLESNQWNAASNEATVAKVAPTGIKPDVLQALLTVKPEYLNAALDVINQQYGGMDAYLRNTLKVDVDAIKRNYLTR
ncbi:Serotype-specific antigen 1 [Pandoraea terrae]|uniref:Serotype-specific antigen 1 n=1 Tax=Pandoraea terrae TaxID=1537710 RepID=A0A5E4TVX8_9BURK|nr:tyrosine-protein phosphatase [Pandoraea terrae]VVD90099.1 Serotype-specific antigen 1 [Pandoraea terrae]